MNFRYARHCKNISQLTSFYTSVLNLEVLGSFQDHDGYDGVLIGLKGLSWHLEYTQNTQEPHSRFDEDDALVFYPDSLEAYSKILDNLKLFKIKTIESKNPYWKDKAVCFKDCDEYNIIVSSEKINQ